MFNIGVDIVDRIDVELLRDGDEPLVDFMIEAAES